MRSNLFKLFNVRALWLIKYDEDIAIFVLINSQIRVNWCAYLLEGLLVRSNQCWPGLSPAEFWKLNRQDMSRSSRASHHNERLRNFLFLSLERFLW